MIQLFSDEKEPPRVGVAVFVKREGKVLLGQRKGAHGALTWATPGGHLEFGETVEACALRELLEETGLRARSIKLGPWVENIMENGTKHYITIFTIVDQFEGEPQLLEPHKCAVWEWFSWDSLPQPLFPSIVTFLEQNGNAKAHEEFSTKTVESTSREEFCGLEMVVVGGENKTVVEDRIL